ncbi:MAG: hypothetical protein ABI346_08990 [Candidatus Baltobacteraceae bacterium]
MRYLGTSFSLTLGAWKLRLRVDLEDALDGDEVEAHARASAPASFAESAISR